MIGGINSDVTHNGRTHHVQTEDIGVERQILRTVIFLDGMALTCIEKTYEDLAGAGEEALRKRLSVQHQTVVAALVRGRFDASIKPDKGGEAERCKLVVSSFGQIGAGCDVTLLAILRMDPSTRPLGNASLKFGFSSDNGVARTVHETVTNVSGYSLATFHVPDGSGGEGVLVIEATSSLGESRVTMPILGQGATQRPYAPVTVRTERPNLLVFTLGPLCSGVPASLLLLLRSAPSWKPVGGAAVEILLSGDRGPAERLYEGTTDSDGLCRAEVELPAGAEGDTVHVQALHNCDVAETVFMIEKSERVTESHIPAVTSAR